MTSVFLSLTRRSGSGGEERVPRSEILPRAQRTYMESRESSLLLLPREILLPRPVTKVAPSVCTSRKV